MTPVAAMMAPAKPWRSSGAWRDWRASTTVVTVEEYAPPRMPVGSI
jgi:hypothetical protein